MGDFRESDRVGSGHAPRLAGTVINGGDTSAYDMLAGRAVLMLFLGNAGGRSSPAAIASIDRHRNLFDDERASMVGFTLDPPEGIDALAALRGPGQIWIHDPGAAQARRFGVVENHDGRLKYAPCWLLFDIRLRLIDHAPIAEGERMFAALEHYLGLDEQKAVMPAPVLVVPRLFEPDLCRRLIEIFERDGGQESGFIRLVDGKPTRLIDGGVKRRSDLYVTDPDLQQLLVGRIKPVLFPMIEQAFQFRPTRIERLNLACYDGEKRGFFRAHRDNVTQATAHRRFACTINLNAGDYEGGDLRFPEYGAQTYRAPTGGAVVFSCSLMHEALPVTRGRRYAFLPFLYDEAGQQQLEAYQADMMKRSGDRPQETG